MKKILFSMLTVLVVVFLSACSNRNININPEVEKTLLQPESIDVYDIDINKLVVEKEDLREQVKQFPFVSLNPILDYRGKFSDKFYSLKPYKVKAKRIDEIDFWKLQNNPYLVDFIYVLPIWVENFKKVSNDLYQNIGYSYNLSLKEQEILKWWVEQGGVLWLETGIYTTLYDSYTKSGITSASKAKRVLNQKSGKQHFMNNELHVVKYQAKKVDYINYKKREINFSVTSDVNWLKDVENLRMIVNNYAENYFLPDGKVLIRNNNIPLVTVNNLGKGMILSMIPFTYNDTRFDGELLRWKLVEYALGSIVLKKEQNQNIIEDNAELIELMGGDPAPIKNQRAQISDENKDNDSKIIDMRNVNSSTTAYCVQLYSDVNETSFKKILEENKNVKNIRGEIRGKYFVIRAGRYDSLKKASKDVKYYKNFFSDAFARECVYKK